jgi:hypothetical protein
MLSNVKLPTIKLLLRNDDRHVEADIPIAAPQLVLTTFSQQAWWYC